MVQDFFASPQLRLLCPYCVRNPTVHSAPEAVLCDGRGERHEWRRVLPTRFL